jgi:hypothetical protein
MVGPDDVVSDGVSLASPAQHAVPDGQSMRRAAEEAADLPSGCLYSVREVCEEDRCPVQLSSDRVGG